MHYGDEWIRGSERVLLDLLSRIDRRYFQPIVWCNGDSIATEVAALNILVYKSKFTFYLDSNAPRFNPRAFWNVVEEGRKIVVTNKIKVIHANSAAPAQWMIPVARLTKTPLITHLHAIYLRRSRFVSLVHQSDMIVGVSRSVVDCFLKDGLSANKIRVIYNGITNQLEHKINYPAFRKKFGLKHDNLVVTSAGSLIHRKGHDLLLTAFSSKAIPTTCRLLILGDGPECVNLKAMATKLGIQDRVQFCGHLDHNEVARVFMHSDIVALASRNDAFALVLAEAGHFGIPVVATNVGGIPEVVINDVTGLLVPPNDPSALASALVRLASDDQLRSRLGQQARDRVNRLFDATEMASTFQKIYQELALKPDSQFGWKSFIANRKPYMRLLGYSKAKTILLRN